MSRIRVMVGLMPRMPGEIVSGILASQPDVELVDGGAEREQFVETLRLQRPDAVVVGYDEVRREGMSRRLFERCAHLKILAVAGDGRRGSLIELVPRTTELGELSPDRLLEVIRRSVDEGTGKLVEEAG